MKEARDLLSIRLPHAENTGIVQQMSDLPVRNIQYLSYCLTFSPSSTSENLAHRYIVSFLFHLNPRVATKVGTKPKRQSCSN